MTHFRLRRAGLISLLVAPIAGADSIDAYLKAQMSANHIPGLCVAVVEHGQIRKIKSYGFANLEWKGRVTGRTRFQLASTTKALTGCLLMTLVQEGKISLDDPVSAFLPQAPASWNGITIRHLATHSSGIPDLGPDGKSVTSAATGVDVVAKKTLNYAPGEKSGYGSDDYGVLTAILERVTGESLQKLFQTRLLSPLKMADTGFDEAVEFGLLRRSELLSQRASVYLWDRGLQNVYSFLFPAPSYSAGGLYSTITDLANWARALDTDRLLTPGAKSSMWSPHNLNNGQATQWGIGWVVRTYNGDKTVGHSGGPALSDVLRFVDRGLTIIVLQNQERMYPYLAQGVADLILAPSTVPSPKSIPDPDPATTQGLKQMLVSLAAGKLERNAFGTDQDELYEDVRNLLGPYVCSMPPLGSFRLINLDSSQTPPEFTYEAMYGKKPVRWIFDLDAGKKIVGISPTTP